MKEKFIVFVTKNSKGFVARHPETNKYIIPTSDCNMHTGIMVVTILYDGDKYHRGAFSDFNSDLIIDKNKASWLMSVVDDSNELLELNNQYAIYAKLGSLLALSSHRYQSENWVGEVGGVHYYEIMETSVSSRGLNTYGEFLALDAQILYTSYFWRADFTETIRTLESIYYKTLKDVPSYTCYIETMPIKSNPNVFWLRNELLIEKSKIFGKIPNFLVLRKNYSLTPKLFKLDEKLFYELMDFWKQLEDKKKKKDCDIA